MSFYQPSLSLYDILNALSNQAALRRQQEQPHYRRQQGRRAPGVFGQDFEGYGRGYEYPTRYYSVQPEATYYHPVYYGRDGYDEPYSTQSAIPDQSDYLAELLRALAGNTPANYEAENDGDLDNDIEEGQELAGSEESAPANTFLGEAKKENENIEPNELENPFVEALKNKVQEALKGEENNHEEISKNSIEPGKEEQAKDTKSALDLPKPEIPSPIPDPLQVSKPQRRLDLPFSPEVNVYDSPELYSVVLALPGASSKSFKIDYHPSSHELLIKGNVENKIGIDSKFLRISEVKYGAFERSVKLPVLPRIKDEEIKATYCNGLLQVKIPKIKDDTTKLQPKRRIVIEDVPDEELVFEENPNPVQPM
ncbi:LAFE_0H07030g1_1 [Lachancea fermentati]|uniref:LAFE_0H07030g1_1 n=1 Tax=Lachancea fermentati TaxID=4955 RepID=A0A1G4MJT7_LACFM|nr:LAFE_0H07030g1_1 [Lachancea fermentati]